MKEIEYINVNHPVFQIPYDEIKHGEIRVSTGE